MEVKEGRGGELVCFLLRVSYGEPTEYVWGEGGGREGVEEEYRTVPSFRAYSIAVRRVIPKEYTYD